MHNGAPFLSFPFRFISFMWTWLQSLSIPRHVATPPRPPISPTTTSDLTNISKDHMRAKWNQRGVHPSHRGAPSGGREQKRSRTSAFQFPLQLPSPKTQLGSLWEICDPPPDLDPRWAGSPSGAELRGSGSIAPLGQCLATSSEKKEKNALGSEIQGNENTRPVTFTSTKCSEGSRRPAPRSAAK